MGNKYGVRLRQRDLAFLDKANRAKLHKAQAEKVEALRKSKGSQHVLAILFNQRRFGGVAQ